MQTQRQVWKMFQQYSVVSLVVSTYVVVALGLNIFKGTQPANMVEAQSAHICSHTDPTSGGIGSHTAVEETIRPDVRPGVSMDVPDMVDPAAGSADQRCIAGRKAGAAQNKNKVLNMPDRGARKHKKAIHSVPKKPAASTAKQVSTSSDSAQGIAEAGLSNVFPFGQCTWWADQRYYQLHGIFVPWKTGADAANWIDQAHQFGWHVSDTPTTGSIIVLQPGVQGAYSAGHVGVVERLLSDGSVIASSMNWGSNPATVTDYAFHPGPGVAFINQED